MEWEVRMSVFLLMIAALLVTYLGIEVALKLKSALDKRRQLV